MRHVVFPVPVVPTKTIHWASVCEKDDYHHPHHHHFCRHHHPHHHHFCRHHHHHHHHHHHGDDDHNFTFCRIYKVGDHHHHLSEGRAHLGFSRSTIVVVSCRLHLEQGDVLLLLAESTNYLLRQVFQTHHRIVKRFSFPSFGSEKAERDAFGFNHSIPIPVARQSVKRYEKKLSSDSNEPKSCD